MRLCRFDADGPGLSNGVPHFDFADGTRVLSATILKATLRGKPFSDEPFLLVGDQATDVPDP